MDVRAFVCRVGEVAIALPLDCVLETLRPLPLEAVHGAPACVRGLSLIRGGPTPVLDAAALLGLDSRASPRRLVLLRLGARQVALAVHEVAGVRALPADAWRQVPPLLTAAVGESVNAIGALDGELLLVLQDSFVLPPSVWAGTDAMAAGVEA